MKKVNLLTQNTKMLKASRFFKNPVYNFNISSYNNKRTGKITCPFAGICKKYCFAAKGNYVRYPEITKGMDIKHEITLQDNFTELMNCAIAEKKPKRGNRKLYVRIHDSGDFYSPKYINKWIAIMKANPDVRFYAYTKSFSLLDHIDLPTNFDYIKSYGGKHDDLINPETDKHAQIFDNLKDLKRAGYKDCSSYDLYATKWFSRNKKKGLVKH